MKTVGTIVLVVVGVVSMLAITFTAALAQETNLVATAEVPNYWGYEDDNTMAAVQRITSGGSPDSYPVVDGTLVEVPDDPSESLYYEAMPSGGRPYSRGYADDSIDESLVGVRDFPSDTWVLSYTPSLYYEAWRVPAGQRM
jgi:hypothetical protein